MNSAAVTYVPCSQCQKVNRVSLTASAEKEPVCGSCRAPLPLHFGIAELNGTGLQKLIEKSPLPVLCDFWAPWCGPCKAFAPTFQQAAAQHAGRLVFAKLNTQDHQLAGDAFRVRSIPTLILFSGGRERDRLSGALPLDQLSDWLDRSLG